MSFYSKNNGAERPVFLMRNDVDYDTRQPLLVRIAG